VIKALKKMYKEYGKQALPYIELFLGEITEVESKEDYYLDEYQMMGWLTYKGSGPYTVEIKEPTEIYPEARTTLLPRKPPKKKNELLEWFTQRDELPSDFFIPCTKTYAPRYQKLAVLLVSVYSIEELIEMYEWWDKQEGVKQLELYQLLSLYHVKEIMRWKAKGIPSKKPKDEGLADREWD